jgi:hypothetical protein
MSKHRPESFYQVLPTFYYYVEGQVRNDESRLAQTLLQHSGSGLGGSQGSLPCDHKLLESNFLRGVSHKSGSTTLLGTNPEKARAAITPIPWSTNPFIRGLTLTGQVTTMQLAVA